MALREQLLGEACISLTLIKIQSSPCFQSYGHTKVRREAHIGRRFLACPFEIDTKHIAFRTYQLIKLNAHLLR
jgi:hypothetical protein